MYQILDSNSLYAKLVPSEVAAAGNTTTTLEGEVGEAAVGNTIAISISDPAGTHYPEHLANTSEDHEINPQPYQAEHLAGEGASTLADLSLITDEPNVSLVVELMKQEGLLKRSPSATQVAAIHYVVANLVEYGYIDLPTDTNYYQNAVVNPGGVRGRQVCKVRDALVMYGMLQQVANHCNTNFANKSHAARYRATAVFNQIVYRHPDEPLILLTRKDWTKGYRRTVSSIPEYTAEVQEMHDKVKQYRDYIASRDIRLPTADGLKPLSKVARITRKFNRESLDCGGRIYASAWQNVPSELRPSILIDGESTAELDFCSMQANMLRVKQGLKPLIDAYGGGPDRAAVKSMFNIAVNCKSPEQAMAVYDREAEQGMPTGAEAYALMATAMPELMHHMGSDAGVRLMREDSDVMSTILDRCIALDIPVLCIHDSVVCPLSKTDVVQQVMLEAMSVHGYPDMFLTITTQDSHKKLKITLRKDAKA